MLFRKLDVLNKKFRYRTPTKFVVEKVEKVVRMKDPEEVRLKRRHTSWIALIVVNFICLGLHFYGLVKGANPIVKLPLIILNTLAIVLITKTLSNSIDIARRDRARRVVNNDELSELLERARRR